VGKEGFAGQQPSFDITSLPDAPPQVVLQSPQPDDFGSLYVVADAAIPLAVVVQEDRTAVRDVRIRYQRSDRGLEEPLEQTLYAGPPRPPERPLGLASPELGETLRLDRTWNLAELDLTPQTQLELVVVARDYRGGEGASTPPLRLVVVA